MSSLCQFCKSKMCGVFSRNLALAEIGGSKGTSRASDGFYVFFTNGAEAFFREWGGGAFSHSVKTFFKQDDPEHRFTCLTCRVNRSGSERLLA